jgi:hypothetical protein
MSRKIQSRFLRRTLDQLWPSGRSAGRLIYESRTTAAVVVVLSSTWFAAEGKATRAGGGGLARLEAVKSSVIRCGKLDVL